MNKGIIDTQFIQNLLARLDIVDVIGSFIELKKTGKNYIGLCPFHGEKTPSFSVNSDKQFYYCFGCGTSGDAIKFVQEYKNMDFVEAVEYLASSVGMEVVWEKSDKTYSSNQSSANKERKIAIKAKEDKAFKLLSATANFYTENFYADRFTQVRAYWQNRGFSYEIAKLFDIGFAEGKGLSEHLQNQGFDFEDIEQQGLISRTEQGAIKEKFWQRLIFPIRSGKGDILGFGGRVIEANRMPKYLNSPETFLFDKSKILYGLHQVKTKHRKIDRILITEGYLDVIALFQAGIDYAVATMGTAISEFHIGQLLKLTKNLVFCFDGDKAGFKAAQRGLLAILPFLNKVEDVRFLILEAGEDPDSIIKKQGKELFEARINKAIPLVEFFLEFIGANSMDSSLDAKIRLINNSVEYLAQLPKDIYATNFIINKVADLASTSVASVQNEIEKYVEAQKLRTRFSQENQQKSMALKGANLNQAQFQANLNYENVNYALDDEHLHNHSQQEDFYQHSHSHSHAHSHTNSQEAIKEDKRLLGQVSFLLEVLMQKPSLAKTLDEKLINSTDKLFFGILRKLKEMTEASENLSSNDLLAYWYGTEAGNFLLKLRQNSVILQDVDNQFTTTQAQILKELALQEIKHKKNESTNAENLSDAERNQNLLQQIEKLKALKK